MKIKSTLATERTMSYFTLAIHTVLPHPCHARPFVCDGEPERCSTIVIGENPASELDVDWWSFWDDNTGFKFDLWTEQYSQSRLLRGKPEISNTRRRLNRLRENGILCLETNVFMNERLLGAGSGILNTGLLEVALAKLPNIQFIIAHGKVAEAYLSTIRVRKGIHVFPMRHFRSESYLEIDRVSNEITSKLASARST